MDFKIGTKAECIKFVNGSANGGFLQFGNSGNGASLELTSEAFFLEQWNDHIKTQCSGSDG
jgi:hypothetical protein